MHSHDLLNRLSCVRLSLRLSHHLYKRSSFIIWKLHFDINLRLSLTCLKICIKKITLLKFYPLREDFVQFAKSSKAVKSLVEKQTKVSMKEMARQKNHKNIKIDKALAAFKVK